MSKPTRKLKVGDVVEFSFGQDSAGRYWWIETSDPTALPHGPFRTYAEADKNSRDVTFGPKFKFKEGGTLHPAPGGVQ